MARARQWIVVIDHGFFVGRQYVREGSKAVSDIRKATLYSEPGAKAKAKAIQEIATKYRLFPAAQIFAEREAD
jgi:hypothetical protein